MCAIVIFCVFLGLLFRVVMLTGLLVLLICGQSGWSKDVKYL